MQITGIIAEYNPLHNGHAYHIREAKRRTGCDYVIVAMSGNYVQRGTPAIFDKYVRAEAALRAGADMVIELPLYSATASAERFAEGAIRLFHDLGVVSTLSYGVEVPEGRSLSDVSRDILSLASFLVDEPEEYRLLLREEISKGSSFPAAREIALRHFLPKAVNLLSTPNNILAVEYEKQRMLRNATFTTAPIARIGSGYHETTSGEYCSATAIRTQLSSGLPFPFSSIPAETRELYEKHAHTALFADDFSHILYARLQFMTDADIADYGEISEDLARRVFRLAQTPFSYSLLGEQLKNRSVTRTHVDRALCSLMLGITKENIADYRTLSTLPYAHVLGIRSRASELLRHTAKNTNVPLIIRLAADERILTPTARALFAKEATATALYYQVLFGKTRIQTNEYAKRFLICP